MIKRIVFLALLIWCGEYVFAQDLSKLKLSLPPDSTQFDVRTTNFPKMKELYFVPIPGAPLLGQPFHVDGSSKEVRVEEHGLAYPTLFDWNRDGKPDLLVGEFLTGQSRIKVFINVGTKRHPKFTGDWFYATDVHGDTISNYQWCCIGIHPQIVDVDGDGYLDIVSGQYQPGIVSWWRGCERGFLPRQEIEQLGYQEGKESPTDPYWSPTSLWYWNYSSARLADFNGDGLLDLFVAGTGGYRVALNVGTREEPKFGRREFLFHTDGTILHTYREPGIPVVSGEDFQADLVCAGTTHSYLNPVDWDGDGVLDIIATDEYTSDFSSGVYFLRGVMTDDGLRFEQACPLFLAKDGSKALPGCTPHIQVVDYNGDGIQDIIMGLSIPTINGFEGATDLYWHWTTGELGLQAPGKDTGESLQYYEDADELKTRILDPSWKRSLIGKLEDWKYITLRHRGYVFVFPGKENKQKALAIPRKATRREFFYDVPAVKKEVKEQEEQPQPVKCSIGFDHVNDGLYVRVAFETIGTYHLYSPSKVNANQVPVSIEITLPKGFVSDGPLVCPPVALSGANEIYQGTKFQFVQKIKVDSDLKGFFEIKVKVGYQTCSNETCLPPEEKEESLLLTLPLESSN
ncbi:MAG: VCBS repeat-containing protein [Bacteroidales bacterium]|nr:VCBS repeat-containing protein [Bacteroidales bacterium]